MNQSFEMTPLTPIPAPRGHRWRQFRIKGLPALMFLGVLGATVLTWRQYVAAPSVVGEVDAVRANVISTAAGLLSELNVERFDSVRKGQVIARVCVTEPEQLKASLVAVEMDLRVLRARMALDEQRNELNYEQLRLDYLTRRSELAVARANLRQAESELHRMLKLHEQNVASESEREIAVRNQERFQSEVDEKTTLVAAASASLDRLLPIISTHGPHPKAGLIQAAIEAQENRLLLMEGPVDLKAPADGVVSAVNHRAGERILAGDPIVVISPMRSERIVGYVRQPLKIVPKIGQRVQVRTRGPSRQIGETRVANVGTEMQYVSAPLRIRGYDNSQERGLPFLVNIPEGMQVYPGELVDLIILQN